ncbi:MAG: hypothetical protein K0S26_1545, partial [Bacteroidota bacterium]|nr:hypothetical protein [Bacteroidota bacterium]
MKFFTKSFRALLCVVLIQQLGFAQTCPTSSITASSNTTICSGQCANLNASVTALRTTSTYTVGATPYAPFSFTAGTSIIGAIDDTWSSALNIGFNFCYFGNTFNQLKIGSNGEITFDLTVVSNTPGSEFYTINNALPNLIEHAPNTICGPYRDIDPSAYIPATVTYTTTGVAPCRRFIASWNDVPLWACNTVTPRATFQIVLYEKSNIIDMYIQNS